jgi:hypothetical protein
MFREQKRSGVHNKNGQEMAKRSFAKTDMRYWSGAIFKPTYREDGRQREVAHWAARMQWRGRRELFSLGTSNKAAASAKARDIYTMLLGAGWEETLNKYKPPVTRQATVTIGEFLEELRSHWSGKPKTFEDYCRSFRRIVSQIFGIEGGRARFDYVNGGRKAWLATINAIKIAEVTPELVDKWRINFVKEAGANPLRQRRARISCNSMLRQAKSLFAPKLIAHIALPQMSALPFNGVAFYRRESMRYRSTLDIQTLISDALRELPREQLKIFLLATMAGLRREEIDKLQWQAFHWSAGVIRIEATSEFAPKTADSAEDVPVDEEFLTLFRRWQDTGTGRFVVESDQESRVGLTYTHYRAERSFTQVIAWLRSKNITAPKPLHELRKEFGSQLCAKYGIYAASRMLRHSDIGITAQHYLDRKERVTLGMGNLLTVANDSYVSEIE